MKSSFAGLVVIIGTLALVACGETSGEVTGVVTEVDAETLTNVNGFTVRSDDETYEFVVDSDTELEFPPAHLNEHRVSGEPVQVTYEERDGELYAVSVEDG